MLISSASAVTKRTRTGPTAERFVEETLSLIAERGGSHGVNLREVSRRVGCAHTNVYNYYASFDDLLWAAFRRTLRIYGEYLVNDLHDSLQPLEYFRRLVSNLVAFPLQNPGLYRFIASDPIDVEQIPRDVLETVSRMKRWLFETLEACAAGVGASEAEESGNIILAYIDGETLNLINGRVIAGEDVRGRVVDNALRLFALLTRDARIDLLTRDAGIDLEQEGAAQDRSVFPRLPLEEASPR
jgi:AcrR family transcriptional regulator